MKPRSIWLITALCLALLGGAMAWITRSMLRMEDEQNRMANEARLQEMARLSLWRMEGIASALVITESARPPEHYRTFSTPDALLKNGTFSNVNKGDVLAISPLLTEPSDFCKLYFEMDGDGTLRSPQVPVGEALLACTTNNVLPEPVMKFNEDNLSALCGRIDRDDSSARLKEMRDKLRVPSNLTGNRALMWTWNSSAPATNAAPQQTATQNSAPVPAPAPEPPNNDAVPAQLPAEPAQTGAAVPNTRMVQQQQSPAYAMQQRAMKFEDAKVQQLELNTEEEKARQEFVASSVGKAANRRAGNYDNAITRQSQRPEFANTENDNATPAAVKMDAASAAISAAKAEPQQVVAKSLPPVLPEATPVREVPSTSLTPAPASVVPVVTPSPPPPVRLSPGASAPAAPEITDFRPLWLGDALLLTRRVTTPERQWIQGAWLDWDKLRIEMLDAVKDRFPSANVVRALENPEPGAHLLASLPVQLVPGSVTFPPAPFWSPLKVSLSIAWLCVLLAVAAVALVLRGMMSLSERRASFVSSVTHELRTPLATFKIYSEMLADGMVKEEAKKQQYLETLTGEADRLGHLVENVLAYSRIERGKGPTAAAPLRTGDLVDRIEPRLNQRTLLAGMDFGVIAAPGTLDIQLRTDAGAVEQILCNLVDNACKYGRPEGSAGKVELVISRERRRLCLAVRDYGDGIPKSEQNTIFLPFHKSARDAAHSAPGVGLGLALCRRLACELGGTLEIDRSWKQGACFVLRLPV